MEYPEILGILSMQPEYERNASFHDKLAAQYDSHLRRSPGDVLARTAFQDLVIRNVAPGSTLLDFGCGTGLDALEYAKKGYRVLAYDNSPGMLAQLRQRCDAEIASGRVAPYSCPYPSFLDRFTSWTKPDAITANFAVLNSIQDLRPLFETIGRHMAASGWFIASILNPLHWSKVKTRGWWRDALRAPRGPRIHTTEPYVSYLHFVPEILGAAKGFRLVGRANAGAVVRYDVVDPRGGSPTFWRPPAPHSAENILWRTPAYKLQGHFLFASSGKFVGDSEH